VIAAERIDAGVAGLDRATKTASVKADPRGAVEAVIAAVDAVSDPMDLGYRQAGYMVFAWPVVGTGFDRTRLIPLADYAGANEREVKEKVLQRAEREGFRGTAAERLAELGWTIEPVYFRPPSPT
jgi:hypothetical protein